MEIADIIVIVCAYLMGSVPTSIWVGRRYYNKDVREHGSGNAGATNTFRVLGTKAGIVVFLIDGLKGAAAVLLYNFSSYADSSPDYQTATQIFLGIAAVVGHIFPIFAGFRGGKGVATLLGVGIAIHPVAAGLAASVFSVVFLISRYVSLGSILGGISFSIFSLFILEDVNISLSIFSVVVALLLVFTHRKNIKRIFKGTESKIHFKPKR